jgi:hypothetical protein
MGLNSLHRQVQVAAAVTHTELMTMPLHHSKLRGIECEYNEVMRRWMKCSVSEKSRTSLERVTKRVIAATLYSYVSLVGVVSIPSPESVGASRLESIPRTIRGPMDG